MGTSAKPDVVLYFDQLRKPCHTRFESYYIRADSSFLLCRNGKNALVRAR